MKIIDPLYEKCSCGCEKVMESSFCHKIDDHDGKLFKLYIIHHPLQKKLGWLDPVII